MADCCHAGLPSTDKAHQGVRGTQQSQADVPTIMAMSTRLALATFAAIVHSTRNNHMTPLSDTHCSYTRGYARGGLPQNTANDQTLAGPTKLLGPPLKDNKGHSAQAPTYVYTDGMQIVHTKQGVGTQNVKQISPPENGCEHAARALATFAAIVHSTRNKHRTPLYWIRTAATRECQSWHAPKHCKIKHWKGPPIRAEHYLFDPVSVGTDKAQTGSA
jgi:hypothetical protein